MFMSYEAAKTTKAFLEAECKRTGAVMRAFPRGPMGLTPDAIKRTPEWREARAADVAAFARLRKFNTHFLKAFEAEYKAEREARAAKRQGRVA